MPRIHVLSRTVVDSIAAGEVVERPAVVVKELIENAMDAAATQMTIAVEENGLQKIRVSDNGSGMEQSDLRLSFLRHTTSKIQSENDLTDVKSYGFRGEALASIASVSRLTLQSKMANDSTGHLLVIENGDVVEDQPIGMPNGTIVTVEELFGALPARRKFLKSGPTELRHMTEVVIAAALSHPEIGLLFTHNQKIIFSLPEGQNLTERAGMLLGIAEPTHLLPIQLGHTYFQVQGMIGAPQVARRLKNAQFLFVNHRPISDPHLAQTIKAAYGSLLAPRAEPLFILHLNLPPSTVDVNIHPRKETIKFMNEKDVNEFVQKAIKLALYQAELTYNQPLHFGETTPVYSTATSSALKKTVDPWQLQKPKFTAPVLQVHKTYLIFEDENGLQMIDQHAAHERILYEQFAAALTEQTSQTSATTHSHPLPKPLVIELSITDHALLLEHIATFQKIGFEIEEFGQHHFRITQIPELLKDRAPAPLLRELLDDLSDGKPVKGVDSIAQKTIAYLACRNAIKAGDTLTQEQAQELIAKLQRTHNHITCPHGRPTTITFTIKDLERMFRRR